MYSHLPAYKQRNLYRLDDIVVRSIDYISKKMSIESDDKNIFLIIIIIKWLDTM